MRPELKELGERLGGYLSQAWREPVNVESVQQVPGGASRETYRVQLSRGGRRGGIILRRDPPSSLIDTERALEFRTYQAVHSAGFPVPEPLLLEEDASVLERPFSIMAEVPGCESSGANFDLEPWRDLRQVIGGHKWTLLGRLAALPLERLGVDTFMETPEHPAARELEYWAGVIRSDALTPQPIAEATIRWLERNLPPPSGRLCLVHGDYRSGNFLYDTSGAIRAVLDWEMAHIGDPLEDLAWSLDPLWPWPERHLAGGLLPRADAIGIWERASDMRVDREAFRWWQIFASLKGLAIWISSTEDFHSGTAKAPILAVAGWLMTDRQNRILADRLSPTSPHRYAEPVL